MDNKITKKRLFDLLSYEWIIIVAVCVAIVFLWELIFGIFSVKLTTGQYFKFYYDVGIDSSSNPAAMYALDDYNAFSYDILKAESEELSINDNILLTRLLTHEGDAIFTRTVDETGGVRAKLIIDNADFTVYNFERLLADAKAYLNQFLKDENLDCLDYANMSEQKIDYCFLSRMAHDNRFRSESEKEDGKILERQRINRICTEAKKFEYLLSVGDEKNLFYRYTRFEQKLSLEKDNAEYLNMLIQNEIDSGRENAIYGLNMGALTNGKHDPQEYSKIVGRKDATDTVLLIFDFKAYQKDLQFETISFINTFISKCSDIYDNY